ncbi:hypothetical protein [Protaetiibacter intestinalis]|uniref:hypothetical protein n=1 Tax=Protaetiibacter intestinalis TaxID=2419774 RepID=UPI001300282D|nr:hypothetical protein [Protaetiibacter intestinalis]
MTSLSAHITNARTRLVPRRSWSIGVFIVALAVFLVIAFPALGDTRFYGIGLDATVPQLLKALGGSDSGSYTTLAYDYLDGTVDASNRWILNLWPPGVPFLLWVIMSVNGGALPIVPMLVITGIVWAAALALLAAVLIGRRAFVTLGLFSLAWLASPLLTGWTIHNGAISSDGISAGLTAILALGIYLTSQPEFAGIRRGRRLRYFGGLGLLLGLLCLLRVTWLFAALAALAALGVYLLIRTIVRTTRRRTPDAPAPLRHLTQWGVFLVGFGLVTSSWTIALGTYVHPGSYSWSSGDYQWAQLWMDDERLESYNARFLIDGEANWACDIDRAQCAELERVEVGKADGSPYDGNGPTTFSTFQRYALTTAITHPGPFIAMRSATTVEAWFAVPGDPVSSWTSVPFGALSLLTFLAAIVILAIDSIRGRSGPFLLLMLAGAHLAMIWLTHFETRYMMTFQVIGLVVIAIAVSPLERRVWHRIRTRKDPTS